jgi:hypothetical protein
VEAHKNKRKWLRIKSTAMNYISTISIPGIPQIMSTNNFILKLTWILLIILTFGLGFWNIALTVTDYYRYDKITNIERVTPTNVTFPAITICNYNRYIKDLYVNGSFINSSNLTILTDKKSTISNLINWEYTHFFSEESNTFLNVTSHLDFFKIPDNLDCLRFNGVRNKSVELFTTNTTQDFFQISLFNSYNESLSWGEYFNVRIVNKVRVFITNNYLKSFDKLEPFTLDYGVRYDFDIAKESIEIKLPEPYNQCKEFLSAEPYQQSNCLDTCLYKEIRKKYNCSFLLSLYSFDGFRRCHNSTSSYKREFSKFCLSQCPLESCHSEKFTSLLKVNNKPVNTYLKFSFIDFSTLNITQIPKTDLFTFINNIGGGLGLFMGIAFPNVIEFLQFITNIFMITFF